MSKINGFVGRRNFIKFLGLTTLSVSGISACNSLILDREQIQIPVRNPNPNPVSAEEALSRLEVGNRRFSNRSPRYPNQSRSRRESVVEAQYPFAAILGCADSRVPPEMIFDQGLGDLFVVRVAGNVASNIAIGSLEYTTAALGTQLIVVLGHQNCGAVTAAMRNQPVPGRIDFVVDNIKPALNQSRNQGRPINNDFGTTERAVIDNIQFQKERLLKNSQVLGQLVRESRLEIVGAIYNIETGKVNFL
jgi:carbonic anhydrase